MTLQVRRRAGTVHTLPVALGEKREAAPSSALGVVLFSIALVRFRGTVARAIMIAAGAHAALDRLSPSLSDDDALKVLDTGHRG